MDENQDPNGQESQQFLPYRKLDQQFTEPSSVNIKEVDFCLSRKIGYSLFQKLYIFPKSIYIFSKDSKSNHEMNAMSS